MQTFQDRLEVKPERNKAQRTLNVAWTLPDANDAAIRPEPKNPLPNLARHRAHMHPDEVRKRERELLPPLKTAQQSTVGAQGDPKGAKRAKSEIQTKENKTHKTNTKITIEDISKEPISDPTAQYNLIQQIIQADISDPLLLGKLCLL